MVLLLGACTKQNKFAISQLEVKSEHIILAAELPLSEPVITALKNGVGIPIGRTLEVKSHKVFSSWEVLEMEVFEVRYHPLTRQHVVKNLRTSESRSFPELRGTLDYLSEPDPIKLPTLCEQECLIRVRIKIDIMTLPAPLKIPALIEPQWQLDSGWKQIDYVKSHEP